MNRMFLALASLLVALHAAALQQTTRVEMPQSPMATFVDVATGRVFSLNSSGSRSSVSTLGVVHADGRVETITIPGIALRAAFSATLRRLVMPMSSFTGAGDIVVMDIDTFAMSTVHMASAQPMQVVIADATGKAYVAGRVELPGAPWLYPGQMKGILAEIDLRSGAAEFHALPSMHPTDLAASPGGERVYVVGSNYVRTGEPPPAFLNVFDAQAKTLAHAAVPIGVGGGSVAVGRDLYVVTGVAVLREAVPPYAGPMNGARGEIVVMDARTLAVKRRLALPDDKDPMVIHSHLAVTSSSFDLAGEKYYAAMSTMNLFRFVAADLAAGTVREAALEGYANGVEINPVLGHVMVSMPRSGYVGIFDRAGERLDSVPFGRAAIGAEMAATSGMAYHPLTGDAYVASGHERALLVLRAPAGDPSQVVNLTDLWWNPNESGWGLFLDQQATTLFGALFTHAADGSPTWLVMSEGKRLADGSFRGTLYRTSGPRENAVANLAAVGTMQVRLGAEGRATLSYDIHGQAVTKAIERQRFSAAPRSCGWTVGTAAGAFDRTNFTALWFNAAEPGWGLAISQQGDIAFGVLFTFDAQNRATWTAMSNGVRRGVGSFSGELFKSRSSAPERVGLMSIDMTAPAAGSVTFNMEGLQQTKPITRQVFAPLTTSCTQ